MRIIYFGSDCFGIPSLEELKKNHTFPGIVTAPDRPKGRGLKLSCPEIKDWALKNDIPVYQPERLSDESFIRTMQDLNPDLIVLISYGKILPVTILKTASIAAINVHPSLLPKYRGAAPMEWALINGDKKTGITVMTMHGRIDTGDVIMQKEVAIADTDDIFSLKKRLSEISPGLLAESLNMLLKGVSPTPQKGVPSRARKLVKKDGLINWAKSASEIHNLVRGVKEWPGAYTYLNGRYLKIFNSIILPSPPADLSRKGDSQDGDRKHGEIIDTGRDSIVVACGKDALKITEVQMEGKRRMPVSEFLKGFKIQRGDRFSHSSIPSHCREEK